MASDTWVDNYAPQSRGRKSAVAQEGMPAAQSFSYRDVTCHAYRGFPSAALSRDTYRRPLLLAAVAELAMPARGSSGARRTFPGPMDWG